MPCKKSEPHTCTLAASACIYKRHARTHARNPTDAATLCGIMGVQATHPDRISRNFRNSLKPPRRTHIPHSKIRPRFLLLFTHPQFHKYTCMHVALGGAIADQNGNQSERDTPSFAKKSPPQTPLASWPSQAAHTYDAQSTFA